MFYKKLKTSHVGSPHNSKFAILNTALYTAYYRPRHQASQVRETSQLLAF